MHKVVWLDPSLENVNAGDEIIAQAVADVVPGAQAFPRLTTHRRLRRDELSLVSTVDTVVVGGTNILNSRLLVDRQWPMPPRQIRAMWNKVVFAGSGWWQYQRAPDPLTRRVFKGLSHPDVPHAARDSYTADRLSSMGVEVIMTGCPTMWELDGVNSRLSPGQDAVAATITDYHLDPMADRAWIELLTRYYDRVLMVGMGPGDKQGFESLGPIPGVHWAGSGLDGIARARQETSDHVGTRLHAAVRWLQLGGSTVVVSVDNRATEIGKDTGLPCVTRTDESVLAGYLDEPTPTTIRMPVSAIESWKAAWSSLVGTAH